VASSLEGEFVMTYDNATEVAEMALSHGFDIEQIPMKGTHHNLTNELIVGRDLSWARI
jgi:DNA adenine methylase